MYPNHSFLVPPQGLCFKSVSKETYQDLTIRTFTKEQGNDFLQSPIVLVQYHVGFLY
jgi:hypothetical protein